MPRDGRRAPARRPSQIVTSRAGTVFVATLWLEETDARTGAKEWRWRVIDLRTGEQRYFAALDAFLEYVGDQAGVAPPS